VSVEDANGFSIAFDLGSVELVVAGFQDIQGTSSTKVNVCVDGFPPFDEEGLVTVDIDWHFALLVRGTAIEARIGPVKAEAGLELGMIASSLHFGRGTTMSAVFDVDEDVHTIGGVAGGFVSLRCTLGGIQVKSVLDMNFQGVGSGPIPENMYVISIGVGIGF